MEKGELARHDIQLKTGNKNIKVVMTDLASLTSIKKAAEKIYPMKPCQYFSCTWLLI